MIEAIESTAKRIDDLEELVTHLGTEVGVLKWHRSQLWLALRGLAEVAGAATDASYMRIAAAKELLRSIRIDE